MLFKRNSIGIEISSQGVACVHAVGSTSSLRIEKVSYAPFPQGTLQQSMRDLNILDSSTFVNTLKSSFNSLLCKSVMANISLPDAVSRIVLIDMEERFKSREEAYDLIKWKLKKSMPLDIADTHLDFQQLAVRENGDLSLLVAMVSRAVINQYEEMILQSGITPAHIDCNTLSLCRLFANRLELQDDAVLVSLYGNTLSIVAFSQGVPVFVRNKELSATSASDSRIFMEINSSLMIYRERYPEREVVSIFTVSSHERSASLNEMVAEATSAVPVALEIKGMVTPGNAVPGDQVRLFPYTAAAGAALRGL